MNISTLANLIIADKTLLNDVEKWLEILNTQNIEETRNVVERISQETVLVSFAERNGGPATKADVDAAVAFLKQQPLIDETEKRLAEVSSAVASGKIKTAAEVNTAIAAVTVAIDPGKVIIP
jgi:hypothetical protein